MRQASQLRFGLLSAAIAAVGFGSLFASHTQAAVTYFDTNGTASGYGTAGTYSWETNNWANASGGTTATNAWIGGTAAGFNAAGTWTLNVGSNESVAGIFLFVGGTNVTVNQAASTSGQFTIPSGMQGFSIASSTNKGTLVLNVPMTGAGGVQQQGSGSISLFGNNSYTGGTTTTGGQNLNYNNNNSFGTGTITFTSTSGQGIINAGPAGVTIANPVTWGTANGVTNFASGPGTVAAPGAIWSGAVTLPATGAVTMQTGSSTQVTKISGAISGASGIKISPGGTAPNNGGTMIFAGANTYTGATTVTGPSKLVLGAANVIPDTTSLILAGGTLDPDGFNQSMVATLGLTASSTIDFSAGAVELDFANSSALAWTGTLNLVNWDPAVDRVRFDSSPSGLTSAQLAAMTVNGAAAPLYLDAGGYLSVPEPASLSLLGIGAAGLLARRRRA